jgi:hypothetical protein
VRDLPDCARLLQVSPQFRRQLDSYDKMLRIITHLLHLVTRLQNSESDFNLRKRIHHIVHKIDPRSTAGDTLLHLSVMKNNTLKSQNLFEEGQYAFFPSFDVTKLLIECGAKINAMNTNASTPLHTASLRTNYKQEVRRTSCVNPFNFPTLFKASVSSAF